LSSPTLTGYNSTIRDTVGNALPGATVVVLQGQTDTVDVATQPGTPLAAIFADPYQNSQIPQSEVILAGEVSTVSGSPTVNWVTGNLLSEFLVGQTIVINGVQYTVGAWVSATQITLNQNALSSGDFTYSATIPADPLVSDDLGNVEFWASGGWYVLQIYDTQMPEQAVIGITLSHV
jgi:hypothetical protein